jgi:hypothetical protein
MPNRVQLSDQDVEDVVGGRFSFYQDENDNYKCKVTTTGHLYNTTEFGSSQYKKIRVQNPGLTEQQYEELCLQKHIIW